jgi:mannose/cellobiose epimerase-like protein (N-acyl-D-glucosamine 2-epimerase family)
MPGPSKARDAAQLLRRWACDEALPLWASTGVDAQRGGFHERLTLDGQPDLAAPRRLVVQARQIYVYAHAHVLGWFPQGGELALRAWQFVRDHYHAPDGKPGYVHMLAPDGGVHDARRDSYGHAFVVFALGWLARSSGDAQVRAHVDEALEFIDEHLTAPDGTLYEGSPRTLPRRQNPHMHSFEAMLALHETIAHPQALKRAAALRALLHGRFLTPQGLLAEFFTDDWQLRDAHDPIEPGHHAEWAWLLHKHDRMASLPRDPAAKAFTAFALNHADPTSGLIPDEVLADGAPHPRRFRCWPQTELAKALLAAHESGDADARDQAADALLRLHARYLTGCVPGGWIDQFDAAGNGLVDHMPASTFYHLFCAIAEGDRVLLERGAD